MPGLTMRLVLEDIKKLETEALIVGFYEDVRPLKGLAGELDWLLCGSLSNLILTKKVRGSLGDMALLSSQGKVPAPKIFLVGLGQAAGFSLSALQSAARNAANAALGAGVSRAAVEYFPSSDAPYDSTVTALYQGLTEGAKGRSFDVVLLASDSDAYENIARLFKA